jgi:hypothetical protein
MSGKSKASQKAYIFLCSDLTEGECLKEGLFGGKVGYKSQVREVNPGDKLFLYNYSSRKLHGIFEATSQARKNIVPRAWNGRFPWQVRVMRLEVHKPLSKPELDGVLLFGEKGFPRARVRADQLKQLETKFRSVGRVSREELQYRRDYPAYNQTDDGHFVRSSAEAVIDDWLFHHKIIHGYELSIPVGLPRWCDFLIPIPGTKDNIYIEYWGLEDEKYLGRKEEKLELYRKHGLKLVELVKGDLGKVDEVLPRKLERFLEGRRFEEVFGGEGAGARRGRLFMIQFEEEVGEAIDPGVDQLFTFFFGCFRWITDETWVFANLAASSEVYH